MNRTVRTLIVALAALAMMAALPGCVAWKIKRGIEDSNEQLSQINLNFKRVDQANAQLEDVSARLEQTNEQLAKLETILAELNTIETRLETTNKELETVEASLVKLEEHLASLRRTLNNIDTVVPFLRISGDDKQEKKELEEGK